MVICAMQGIRLFAGSNSWLLFFRATATVSMTTFALSLNLNSGRFDFSLGAISALSSTLAALMALRWNLSPWMMLISTIALGGGGAGRAIGACVCVDSDSADYCLIGRNAFVRRGGVCHHRWQGGFLCDEERFNWLCLYSKLHSFECCFIGCHHLIARPFEVRCKLSCASIRAKDSSRYRH